MAHSHRDTKGLFFSKKKENSLDLHTVAMRIFFYNVYKVFIIIINEDLEVLRSEKRATIKDHAIIIIISSREKYGSFFSGS